MPQLDPTSFSSQLFWLTISFVVLYLVLARFLLPRVQSVLTLRSHTVKSDIDQAETMRAQAEEARETYEKALAEARSKSQDLLSAAHIAITKTSNQKQAELDKEIEKKLAASDAAIRTAKQGVLDKLAPVSNELASLIIEVLVHHKPSAKELGAVISELSKERMV